MTSRENEVLLPMALSLLQRRAGSDSDLKAVAATTAAACDDLALVLVPVIGQVGFDAVTARALYLAKREYPAAEDAESGSGVSRVTFWLKQQEEGSALDAAATMLSSLSGLLVTFIGEPLTMRLLRKGWPEGFPELNSEEKPR